MRIIVSRINNANGVQNQETCVKNGKLAFVRLTIIKK